MENSIGRKIAFYRKSKGMTQDGLAEALGVTPQAVSKWENDAACPDIALLAPMSRLFGTSIDYLLSNEPVKEVRLLSEEQRKNVDDMILKIVVNSKDGDKVRVNLPLALIKAAIEVGLQMPQINGNDKLKHIDFSKIMALVEKGVIGRLMDIESGDGDTVHIEVE